MTQHACSAADQYRQLELDRLDALQAAIWCRAIAGDCSAVAVALKIMEQRVKLLGLTHKRRNAVVRPIAVVVPETPATKSRDEIQPFE